MKAEVRQTTEIKLVLTAKEARWLRSYLQNAMVDDELDEDFTMRSNFFNLLYKPLQEAGE